MSGHATTEPLRRFAGRRALVTSASRGIGAAIAERLAAEGADVALVARTRSAHTHLDGSLDETAERCMVHGASVAIVVADLTDVEQRAGIVPSAVDQLGGPLDILVNNAAAAIYQPVTETSLKRRHLMFEANVHAPLDLATGVIPAMTEAGRAGSSTSPAEPPACGPGRPSRWAASAPPSASTARRKPLWTG